MTARIVANAFSKMFSDPEAYDQALHELRRQPDIQNLGLGPNYDSHSLDQIVSLAWPAHLDEDRYKYQHAEYLLDQAADLLDRGVRDRTQWEDLYEKWLRNALEVYELLAIDEVQKNEEAAGLFEAPYALSLGEESANAKSTEHLRTAARKISDIVGTRLSQQERDLLESKRALLGIMGTIESGKHGEQIGSYFGEPIAMLQTKVDQATREIVKRELQIEQTSFEVQGSMVDASVEAGAEKAAGLKKKADFDKMNRTFQSERRAIARKVVAAKQLASVLDGGALNFESRMKPIETRYKNDFQGALARIQAAALGLKLLYGYTEELPAPNADELPRFFDDCLIWVRKAISFLVRFQRLDQSYVLAFSLKRLCGEDWARRLAAGVLKFHIGEADFPGQWNQRHVRLRGFSVFALGDAGKGVWQVVVTAPRASFCVHMDGARHDLDQVRASPCLAGRVSGRETGQQPDILGAIEFFNLSPFGDWEVRVPSSSLEGIEAGKIEDIHLDFHLTARVLG